jgi:hypothetical protein
MTEKVSEDRFAGADFSAGNAFLATSYRAEPYTDSQGTVDTSCSAVWGEETSTISWAVRITYWWGGGAEPFTKPVWPAQPATALTVGGAGQTGGYTRSAGATRRAVAARALVVVLALGAFRLIRLGQSNARDGGQRATYQGGTHQPKRLAPGEGACCKPLGKLV